MIPAGLSVHGAIFGLVVVLLGGAVATASGADTQPSTVPPVALSYSPPGHSTVLGTTFVDWDSLTVRSTPIGQSRSVFDNPTPTLEKFEVHITTLRPGMLSHAVHQHPWEEMLLIKEGDVEVSINGQKHKAGPGFLIFFASHDPHNLKNVGDKPATYYVINFYTDLVHTVADKPAAEQAVPGKLASSVIDCDSLPVTATDTGSRVSILSSPTLTFLSLGSHITTLNAGKSTQPDIVDSGDELFILKSGVLEASVNGVTSRIKEGGLFYCAPNDKRTFRNIGTTPASYQVIKVVSAKTPK
jgi:quercetin dioxygenase-like cupin family protein